MPLFELEKEHLFSHAQSWIFLLLNGQKSKPSVPTSGFRGESVACTTQAMYSSVHCVCVVM